MRGTQLPPFLRSEYRWLSTTAAERTRSANVENSTGPIAPGPGVCERAVRLGAYACPASLDRWCGSIPSRRAAESHRSS